MISDRLCVLQRYNWKPTNRKTGTHQTKILKILTTDKETQHSEELRIIYNDLTTLSNNLENLSTSTILTGGDFNGKVGKADDFATCKGKWIRGQRNDNEKKLVEWCENNTFLWNTAFQHKLSHIATGQSHITKYDRCTIILGHRTQQL